MRRNPLYSVTLSHDGVMCDCSKCWLIRRSVNVLPTPHVARDIPILITVTLSRIVHLLVQGPLLGRVLGILRGKISFRRNRISSQYPE